MDVKKTNGMRIFAYLIIALVLVINLTNASGWTGYLPDAILPEFWDVGMADEDPGIPNAEWISLSYSALGMLLIIASVAYMLGSFFGPKVQAYAKQTIMSVGKSAFILTLIVSLFYIMYYLMSDTPLGASLNQIKGAENFAQTMRNTIIWEFTTMTTITAIISMIGNMTPHLRPAGMIGVSFSLAPAFKPIFDSLGIMLSSLSVSVGSWFLQYWLLIFIKTRMLQLFLPLGLFLRCLNLRRAGNVLIAIAIGFFFIYPFLVNVTAFSLEGYLRSEFGGTRALYTNPSDPDSYFNTYDECISHAESAMTNSAHCFFKLSFFGSLTYLRDFIEEASYGTLIGFGVLNILTGSITSTIIISFAIIFTLSLIKTTVFYVLIASILVPLFNVFITLTAIKELVKLLGTDIDLSAFEKLF